MLNRVSFIGNIGKIQTTEVNGKMICTFTLAVNESKDKTMWLRCKAWEKKAEVMQKLVGVGSKLYVDGSLYMREYTTKEGHKALDVGVTVMNFVVLTYKKDSEPDMGEIPQASMPEPNPVSAFGDINFEDVPF